MSVYDDECIHGTTPASACTWCNGKESSTSSKKRSGGGGGAALVTPESLEHYRSRYRGEREATFEAYVEVFFAVSGARNFTGGWTYFSRCANAERKLVETDPANVAYAESLMRTAGYEIDDSARASKKGRRWAKSGRESAGS